MLYIECLLMIAKKKRIYLLIKNIFFIQLSMILNILMFRSLHSYLIFSKINQIIFLFEYAAPFRTDIELRFTITNGTED